MSLFNTIMADVDGQQPAGDESVPDGAPNVTTDDGTGGAEPIWWWDKDKPGEGDRPEWLPEKYKTAADAAKAYTELQKKLGTAPEEYNWEAGKGWVEPDYEPLQELAAFAKSKHVSQEVFDKMLGTIGQYLDEFKIDYTEERTKLGEGAEERIKILNNWAKSNFSADTFDALTSNMQTADAVKAIEEIRTKMLENNTTIPTGNEDAANTGDSLEDIQQEMADNMERYSKDAKYRREITAKIERASKNSGFVDKTR